MVAPSEHWQLRDVGLAEEFLADGSSHQIQLRDKLAWSLGLLSASPGSPLGERQVVWSKVHWIQS